MKKDPEQHRLDVALFRHGLICELSRLRPGAETAERLRQLAAQPHLIPGSTRTRVSEQALRDWMRLYRQGGFKALKPKVRRDRGQFRRMSVETMECLISIKREKPQLAVREVIQQAKTQLPPKTQLRDSTVRRLLHREGLMQAAAATAPDCRRFAYRYAGELWMSDVMHGPKIKVGQRRHRSYLTAIIDDASRVIPYAAFARSEKAQDFLVVLKQALLRRGLPQRLYVDNGANYRSQHLALVCARLDIALIHARPYHPAGKGKIERFFRSARDGFVNRLESPLELDALNRELWSWIEGEYHRRPHRGIDALTPLDKWAQCAANVRRVTPQLDLDDLFLFETQRRVYKDRTVRLNCHLYEVDAALIGQTVTLRYDPTLPPTRPLLVVHQGQSFGQATLLDEYANTKVKRTRPGISFSSLEQQQEDD